MKLFFNGIYIVLTLILIWGGKIEGPEILNCQREKNIIRVKEKGIRVFLVGMLIVK